MTDHPRIIVTVNGDGHVNAETVGLVGDRCLDYIAVLEELLGARVQDSAYTTDYTRQSLATSEQQVNRDVDPA